MDGGLLNKVLNDFVSAISGSWGPELQAYLLPLLLALVTLQFGLIAIEATIARDVPLLLMHVLLGIIRVSIVVAIFDHAFEWGNDIVQTGQMIGSHISGISPTMVTPSDVFNAGAKIMQTIFQAKAHGSWFSELFQRLEFFFAGIAVMFCWAVASLIYLGCLLEAALLVYAGPLVIAFTPLSWTFDMLVSWAKSVLAIAFKVALVLMTLGVGRALANQWVATITATSITLTSDLSPLLIPIVESLIFVYVVWKVPTRISGLAFGAAATGFTQDLIAMGATGAAGSAQTAMGGGGGGGSAGGGASSGGGGGEGGGSGGSPGLLSQAGQAARDGAKALAQKIQSKLTT
jgi:type IV secretion system protein VirB6/type IV secretion system protein TrbL